MSLLPRLASFIQNRFARSRIERELDDELETYVELVTDEKIRKGIEPDRARRQAWMEIGGKESVKERVRERRIGFLLDTVLQDVAYGARMFARRPGFTLLASCTLALGIGSTTAIFAVVDGVLLRSLPYPDPERLVFIAANARDGRSHFSPPDYVELREQTRSFDELGALVGRAMVTLSIDGNAAPAQAWEVTASFFSTFGARPFIGRLFAPSDRDVVSFEEQGDSTLTLPTGVVVIGYELWQQRFGADPSVLGRLVELDLQPYRIIGVLRPGFRALVPDQRDYRSGVDVWTLPRMDFTRMPRDVSFLRVVGRLSPDVTVQRAVAEMSGFSAGQRERYPLHREGDYRVVAAPLHETLIARHRASIWVLFGAVGILLLIACANLTNLLLARTLARHQELAIRLALGAGRARLVRQLVTESSLYALSGFALGAPIAWWLTDVFLTMAPATLPRAADIGLDRAVLGFALVVSLLASIAVAFVPAVGSTRRHEASVLRAVGRSTASANQTTRHRVFVVAEVALSVVLVVGTALLLKSLVSLLDVDPGFRPEHVVTAELSIPSRRYPRYPRPDSRVRLVTRAAAEIGERPGVDAAALALVIPLSEQDAGHTFASSEMAASAGPLPPAKYRPVTPGYFDAVGTRLLAGRDFTWGEVENYRLVSIVDEKLAAKAWPGESALGKRLRVEAWSTARTGSIHLEPLWTEVIGVAENVRSTRLGVEDPETVYLPYGLYAVSELSLLVRSSRSPEALTESIREVMRGLDPDMAVFNERLMTDFVEASLAPERFSLDLLTAFGAVGFALALIGLYGVLSHLVSLRQRELGLRIALGASTADVKKLVLTRGARLIAVGLVAGLVAASMFSRLLKAQLYDVSPLDWQVYGAVALVTLGVGLAACYLPARRAAKLDPVTTLRLE